MKHGIMNGLRLVAVGLALVATQAFGQGWRPIAQGWHEIQTSGGGSGIASITITTSSPLTGGAAACTVSPCSWTLGLGVVGATLGGMGADVSGQTGIALNTAGTFSWLASSGTGNVLRVTSPVMVTPTLGVASATSVATTGTAGAGFVEYPSQSSNPAAPASGFREFADATGRKSWRRASDGFVRTWDATVTADRVYSLPDANTFFPIIPQTITVTGPTAARTWTVPDAAFTLARTDAGQTFTGNQTFAGDIIANTDAASIKVGASSDVILTRKGAANWRLGAADAAAPVAQSLSVQGARGGTDSNAAAVTTTIVGSLGTGTGATGTIVFKAGTPQTTGTTQHVAATVLTLKDAGSAGTSAPQAQLPDGTTSAPSLASASNPASGFFFTGGGSPTLTNLGISGLTVVTFGGVVGANIGNRIGLVNGASTGSPDVHLTRRAAADMTHGGADSATPTAQIVDFQGSRGGTDTNTAGSAAIIRASLGTGTAAIVPVSLQAAALGTASGTTQHTAVDRITFGAGKSVTNNTVTTMVNVTNASNTVAIVNLDYGVEVFDGTNLQYEGGTVSCAVINKAGVWSANTCLKHGNQQGLGSGTLTVTWTITGANPALVQVNANSSLTPSAGYPRVNYVLANLGSQAVAVQN